MGIIDVGGATIRGVWGENQEGSHYGDGRGSSQGLEGISRLECGYILLRL